MHADHVARWDRVTGSPQRLAAVRATGLVDGGQRDRFRRLAQLAARLMRAPVGLISLVEADRDVWVSIVGVPDELAAQGGTTLRPSFCQAIIATDGMPLVVGDARVDPVFRDVPGVIAFGIAACLGVPVVTRGGAALGSLCVYDVVPRDWTPEDVDTLSALAEGVAAEFENATATQRVATEPTLRGRWRTRPRGGVVQLEGARAGGSTSETEGGTVVFNEAFTSALSALEMFADLVMHDVSVLSREASTVADLGRAVDGARLVARQVLTLALRPPHARRPVDLSATVRTMDRVLTMLGGGGGTLSFALGERLPPVEMDPFDVERLVFVAVGHARRALGGPGVVRVSTDRDRAGGRFLLLTVEWTRGTTAPAQRDDSGALPAIADIVRRADGLLVTAPSERGGLLTVYLPIAP